MSQVMQLGAPPCTSTSLTPYLRFECESRLEKCPFLKGACKTQRAQYPLTSTWTPKVGNIMAFMAAIIMGLVTILHILLGLRYN